MAIIETVRQIVEPLLAEKEIELIKVDFLKTKGKYHLILTVDKFKGSITLDELGEVSLTVGSLLDEENVIKDAYDLEVASPGLERPLYKLSDYSKFIGKRSKIVLIEPVHGQYSLVGKILKVKESNISIEINDNEIIINFDNIKRGHLVYDIREDL